MTFKLRIATSAAALTMVLPALAAQDAQAARVRVPVDRANPSAGQFSLYVERYRATSRARRTLLYVAGGPGSAGTAEARALVEALGPSLRRRYEVVAYDPRGTGRSGAFRCPELQRDPTLRSTRAAAACARRLGARRSSTTVAEQAEDVEAIRRSLGVRRIDLYGVSFGTEVVQRYLQAHPDRVGRIVLDSVLPPEGPSSLGLEVFAGMPRVLGVLCARRRCPPGMPSPAAEVPALVGQLRSAPLTAPVVDARGRRATARLDPVALLDVLLAGDFSPALRPALPGAVAAARRGDAAPLLRLRALDRAAAGAQPASVFSVGQYAATSCESLELPWNPAADPASRRAQAQQRIAEMGATPFAPFDGQTVLDADFLPLCLAWPAQARAPQPPPRQVPPVPALLLAGEEDLRTPVESARDAASRNPKARVLTVPGVGHAVLPSDDSRCAERAVRAFLTQTRGPRSCRGPRPYVAPVPVPPASIDAFGPGGSAARDARRTLRAVDATLDDAVLALSIGGERGGGLRGGTYAVRDAGVVLRRYEHVPGVRLDADPRPDGSSRIRVSGPAAARGTIVLRSGGRVSGTLAGRRVSGSLPAGPPDG